MDFISNDNEYNIKNIFFKKSVTCIILDCLISNKTYQIVDDISFMATKKVYWSPSPGSFSADRRYNADWDIPALGDASRAVKIYLTRDYYVEKSKTLGSIIDAGEAVLTVGSIFNVTNIFKARNLLSLAGVAYTIYDLLSEACQPVPYQEHEYSWGNKGTVYDTTVHNADVEVWQEWDTGRMNLVNLISGEGKEWGVSAPSSTEPNDLSSQGLNNHAATKAFNVADIYNNNIYFYGQWIHGVGQLGY